MPEARPFASDDAMVRQVRGAAELGLEDGAQAQIEAALDHRMAHIAGRRRSGRVIAWIASHSALVLAGGAVAVGGATAAAVVTIDGTPSPPTAGVMKPRGAAPSRRAIAYSLTMMPSLRVGTVGWCSRGDFGRRGKKPSFGGAGCGPAPNDTDHLLGGGTTFLGQGRGWFAYAIVDDAVAYALAGQERIVPTTDPALPNGWRAIVLMPGTSTTSNLRFRDATDRPVTPAARPDPRGMAQPYAQSRATVPADAPCGIGVPAAGDARHSLWTTGTRPTGRLNGAGFLACAQTALRIEDRWAEITVLLDAARPGRAVPADLTAGTPAPGAGDGVELPVVAPSYFPSAGRPDPAEVLQGPWKAGETALARRVGKAWVLVRAPTRALRSRILDTTVVRVPDG